MRINILPLILVGILITGCATSHKTTSSKTMGIYGAGVIQHPIIAEMHVSQRKVSGYASTNRGGSMSSIRNNAVADALEGTGADILVEPVFETTREGNRLTATVTGYPASYVNFRSITHDDIPLLEAGILQRAETVETTDSAEVRESSTNRMLASILLIGALIGIGLAVD